MSYIPDPLYDNTELGRYLAKELRKIADQSVVNQVDSVEFKIWYNSPDKPRAGQIYYADGSDWNPLSTGNEGLYRYNGSAWVYVG